MRELVKALKIISKTLSTITITAVVLLAVLLGGTRLVGLTPYTVISGSMEPTYHVGSVIYVKEAESNEIDVNDPITYKLSSGTVATHRVVEVLDENTANPSFKTKGDANDVVDGTPVPYSAVIGKPIFSIPYFGYVSVFIQKPVGLIAVIGTCLTVLLISFAIDMLFPKQEDKPETNETDESETNAEQENQ